MASTKKPIYDVAIIGGGAAGMLAAVVASSRGKSVIVIERGDVFGKKLRITGKGRCNLTNNCTAREVIENTPTGGKFLYSAMSQFPPERVMEFFEGLGVPLKTERGRRVFPASDKASDVAEALELRMNSLGAASIRARARSIETADGAVAAIVTDTGKIHCKAAIIATGGLSYPKTGSTGDGYKIAEALGHTIVPPKPSLVPLVSPDAFCAEMQGLALKNVGITVTGNGDNSEKKPEKKQIYTDFGELLFTHFGLSGPVILSASAHMPGLGDVEHRVSIDLKPALDLAALDARLLRDFETQKNKNFSNALGALIPSLMIPVLVARSGIDPAKKVNSITRAERRRLAELFKAFDVRVTGARPIDEAVITSGGVDTREIIPATMESKLVRSLFFAGEVINADAYTGGYNLQIAWATAYAAALAAGG